MESIIIHTSTNSYGIGKTVEVVGANDHSDLMDLLEFLISEHHEVVDMYEIELNEVEEFEESEFVVIPFNGGEKYFVTRLIVKTKPEEIEFFKRHQPKVYKVVI